MILGQQYQPGMLGGTLPQGQTPAPGARMSDSFSPEQRAAMQAQAQAEFQRRQQESATRTRQPFWMQPGWAGQEQARMASNAQAMQQTIAAEQANGYRQGMPLNTPIWRHATREGQDWLQSQAGQGWASSPERQAFMATPEGQAQARMEGSWGQAGQGMPAGWSSRAGGPGDYRSWMNAGLLGGSRGAR